MIKKTLHQAGVVCLSAILPPFFIFSSIWLLKNNWGGGSPESILILGATLGTMAYILFLPFFHFLAQPSDPNKREKKDEEREESNK